MSRLLLFLACIPVGLFAVYSARAENEVEVDKTPSFLNDVMPLFTRFGCNQGACHGKIAGQNGFRLSLRGYAPELDYECLTREFFGRRVNPVVPEESLLLRKPLGRTSHEGGKIFAAGSQPHQVLLAWIRSGMPGPRKNDPTLVGIEVLPGNRSLKTNQNLQLSVRARYSNGTMRDVTWLSKFDSNDVGIATVDANGLVCVQRHGETAIQASFLGQIGVVIVTAPYEQTIDPARFAQRNNFIDEHVFAKLAALHIEPSDLTSDVDFLRRVYLDAIGVLPTPAEVRAFLADTQPDKRVKLIDALLDRPEFVDQQALFLSDLLQNRKERDHDSRGVKGVRGFHEWLREQIIANRPWDEIARAVLTAKGPATTNPGVGYFIVTVGEEKEPARSEIVASVAQEFLGTRIGCAQCHNHPLERYTQDDFYHFAAYFSRLRLDRQDPVTKKPTTLFVNTQKDGKPRTDPVGIFQPRTNQFLKPQPLDGSSTPIQPDEDPRVRLATWITDSKNEYFSGAMVNRLWKRYLGVGLVEPVDDLRVSNPPSNPELWEALNKDFVGHHFDMKHLVRTILNSRTYQLTSATRSGNEIDVRFYSHYYARRLPAEVLLDVLCQSTEMPHQFDGYPLGIRASQVPDATVRFLDFLPLFGKSERLTACACERNNEVTMPQILHLRNSSMMTYKIDRGCLSKMLRDKTRTDDAIIDELYLTTLSRLAPEELKVKVHKALVDNLRKDDEFRSREEVFRDLFWALLNSKGFSFNH